MLYQPVDAGKPTRIQGACERTRGRVGGQLLALSGEPRYMEEILRQPRARSGREATSATERKLDPLFARASGQWQPRAVHRCRSCRESSTSDISRARRTSTSWPSTTSSRLSGLEVARVLMNLPDVDDLLERIGLE